MAITMTCKNGGRPAKFPKSERAQLEFIELYNKHTATELAERYDVKPSTVRAWASRIRKESAGLNG